MLNYDQIIFFFYFYAASMSFNAIFFHLMVWLGSLPWTEIA